jgi:hypothetical protein
MLLIPLTKSCSEVLQASCNQISTPSECFSDAILFSDGCDLTFSTLGKQVVNSQAIQNVALFSLLGHTKVAIINLASASAFCSIHTEIPNLSIFLAMSIMEH